MANLYTKTGDKGTTALVGGSRVSKCDLKVECYGTIDEAISALGLAYAQSGNEFVRKAIHKIQVRLFAVGAELAADENGLRKLASRKASPDDGELTFVPVTDDDISYLERLVDTCTEKVGVQREFVVPGVSVASASLHVARTVARRAERLVVALGQAAEVSETLKRYVNRLSDALYALARYEEVLAQHGELRDKVLSAVKERLGMDKPFTLEVLQRMALRSQKKAREINVPCVFAAVDAGGHLVMLQRMEGSLLISLDVAQGKAFTALSMKMPTHEVGKLCQPGGELYALENSKPGRFILVGGGFPFVVDGKVVGGIGVSGGTAEQDMEIARYAMA